MASLRNKLLEYFDRGGVGTNEELARMFGTSLTSVRARISELRKEHVIVRKMWRYPEGVTHAEYGISRAGWAHDKVYPRRGRPAHWCAVLV